MARLHKPIIPAPVERDEFGYWTHPHFPEFEESQIDEITRWFLQQNLEICVLSLEDERDDHPAYHTYYECETPDISAWNPAPPDGAGWFTLSIHDTEYGPKWIWVKHVEGKER